MLSRDDTCCAHRCDTSESQGEEALDGGSGFLGVPGALLRESAGVRGFRAKPQRRKAMQLPSQIKDTDK